MRIAEVRRGMTLLEIVAALGIAGMAMLGGILLLDQVGDSGARIARDGPAQASEGNGARTFHRLLLEAEPSFDSTRRFRGDARSIEYSTRCQVAAGWTEPCRVSLAVDSLADSSAVSAQFDNGARFVLERHAGMIGFRFFDAASRDSAWVALWSTSATLPTAVGIVLRSDTIVLPVGASRD